MRTEDYILPGHLEDKVEEWLSRMDRKRRWPHGPGKTALLILDMQRFFTDPDSRAFIPGSREIIPIISNIVESFTGPVFLTRHVQRADENNLMNVWWKDRIQGEPSELDPTISGIEGEVVFKENYSALRNTTLKNRLKELDVRSLIITGVMTDLCCETTAREAFMEGFMVYFIADGTATATEERHLASLKAVSTGFGEVISSKELGSLL
ncbi:MAG: isochorismatase family protein [Thermoplasmatota archaeon]